MLSKLLFFDNVVILDLYLFQEIALLNLSFKFSENLILSFIVTIKRLVLSI